MSPQSTLKLALYDLIHLQLILLYFCATFKMCHVHMYMGKDIYIYIWSFFSFHSEDRSICWNIKWYSLILSWIIALLNLVTIDFYDKMIETNECVSEYLGRLLCGMLVRPSAANPPAHRTEIKESRHIQGQPHDSIYLITHFQSSKRRWFPGAQVPRWIKLRSHAFNHGDFEHHMGISDRTLFRVARRLGARIIEAYSCYYSFKKGQLVDTYWIDLRG